MKLPLTFLFAILLFQSLNAQERITVEDPEIRFSYELPAGWVTKDDGYYHIASPIAEEAAEHISITYFSQAVPDFKDFFEGFVEIQLPSQLTNYQIRGQGKSRIDGEEAYWVSYTHSNSENPKVNYACIQYLYPKFGQAFYLTYTAAPAIYADGLAAAQSAIWSFQAEAK